MESKCEFENCIHQADGYCMDSENREFCVDMARKILCIEQENEEG